MVLCEACQVRLAEIGAGEASQRYQVGNRAKDQMGHVMYFTRTEGRTALCVAHQVETES